MGVKISPRACQRLLKQLEEMRNVEEPAIRERISTARDHGDLSENAEYHAAREEMSLLHLKMAQLEEKLAQAQVIDPEQISTDEVQIYTKVLVEDLDRGVQKHYILVSQEEMDLKKGKISSESPIGRGVVGNPVGAVVEITIPAGLKRFKILAIERYDDE